VVGITFPLSFLRLFSPAYSSRHFNISPTSSAFSYITRAWLRYFSCLAFPFNSSLFTLCNWQMISKWMFLYLPPCRKQGNLRECLVCLLQFHKYVNIIAKLLDPRSCIDKLQFVQEPSQSRYNLLLFSIPKSLLCHKPIIISASGKSYRFCLCHLIFH